MIIAAGLTPAWQTIMRFDSLSPGEVNRATEVHRFASGKVLNVAVALAHLGAPCKAIALVGGPPRELIDREFSALGISRHWVISHWATRSCITLLDNKASRTTELVENAGPVTAEELAEFAAVFAHDAEQAQVVVLTGSLPMGVPPLFYKNLLSKVHCPAIVDARGSELLATLEHRPLLVKPNREELAITVQRPLENATEVRAAMSELHQRGAQWVLVSNGGQPALVLGEGRFYSATPPPVEKVINPIGCGDCLAAGFAWAIAQGKPPLESMQWGMAAAAENCGELLAGRLDPDMVSKRIADVRIELDP